MDLTVLDRRNFHLFQPLLYQVATGALSPGEIASPLRAILGHQKNTRVFLAEAVDLDADARKVLKLDSGELHYDTLIVAPVPAAFISATRIGNSLAPGLKTIEEATRIRHKILYAFEAAERETDPVKRREWLTFVVVGSRPDRCRAGRCVQRDCPRYPASRLPVDPPRGGANPAVGWDASGFCRPIRRIFPPRPSDRCCSLGVRPRNKVRVTQIDANGVDVEARTGMQRINAQHGNLGRRRTRLHLRRGAGQTGRSVHR